MNTEIDIDTLEAGRELDALVAERIMELRVRPVVGCGCIVPHHEYFDSTFQNPRGGTEELWQDVPGYSTDIAAAWQVVERLLGFMWAMDLFEHQDGTWWCTFRDYGAEEGASGSTAPLAICRAALMVAPSIQDNSK